MKEYIRVLIRFYGLQLNVDCLFNRGYTYGQNLLELFKQVDYEKDIYRITSGIRIYEHLSNEYISLDSIVPDNQTITCLWLDIY